MRADATEVEAYVLHQRGYRETSALLEMFTRSSGRIGVVAHGVSGPKAAARRAVLQPWQPLRARVAWRGELGRLIDCDVTGPALQMRGDAALAAFYLNELLCRLLPRQEPCEPLFWRYAATLGALEQADSALADLLRWFERDLLAALGYALAAECDIDGGAIDPAGRYRCDLDAGTVRLPADHPGGIAGSALLALRDSLPASPREAVEQRRLLRSLLQGLLGGGRLCSWDLLSELRQLGTGDSG